MALDKNPGEELQGHIAEQLKSVLKKRKKEGLTVVSAARALGVSRQSFHAYLKGTACPSVDILYRACLLWGIVVSYNGYDFGVRSKTRRKKSSAQTKSRQLQLPLTFKELKRRDVDVTVGKKTPRSVQLVLSVNVSA